MKHFIFHRLSEVWAIREEDVPKEPNYDLIPFLDRGIASAEYGNALETALSSKAVKIDLMKTDVYVIDCYNSNEQGQKEWILDKAGKRITMVENQLYDLPEGFEVKIETHCFEPCDCSERCEDWSKRKDVATIVPEESQEELQEDFYINLLDNLNQEAGEDDVPMKFYRWLKAAFDKSKSKYSIQRKR